MKKKIIIIAAICMTLITSAVVGSVFLYASSKYGCISEGREKNNGRCVNDGKKYFCADLSGKDCVMGKYPSGLVTE